jgi:hypothetical protein
MHDKLTRFLVVQIERRLRAINAHMRITLNRSDPNGRFQRVPPYIVRKRTSNDVAQHRMIAFTSMLENNQRIKKQKTQYVCVSPPPPQTGRRRRTPAGDSAVETPAIIVQTGYVRKRAVARRRTCSAIRPITPAIEPVIQLLRLFLPVSPLLLHLLPLLPLSFLLLLRPLLQLPLRPPRH